MKNNPNRAWRLVQEYHQLAMSLSDKAEITTDNPLKKRRLWFMSFAHERFAVNSIPCTGDVEPTRSILIRSATALAIEADFPIEALRMGSQFYSGSYSLSTEVELISLLDIARFKRKQQIDSLSSKVGTLSIRYSGPSVGKGVIETDLLEEKSKYFREIIRRESERISGRNFRTKGRPFKEAKVIQINTLLAKVGSYVEVFEISVDNSVTLFGDSPHQEFAYTVMSSMSKFLNWAQEGNSIELKNYLNYDHDESAKSYYIFYVSLLKSLKPTGKRLTGIEMDYTPNSHAKPAAKGSIDSLSKARQMPAEGTKLHDSDVTIEIIGELDTASKSRGYIEIVSVDASRSTRYRVSMSIASLTALVLDEFEGNVRATLMLKEQHKSYWDADLVDFEHVNEDDSVV